jgi:hypothetical protein
VKKKKKKKKKRDGRCKKGSDQRRELVPEVFWPADPQERQGEGGNSVGLGSLCLFYLLSKWPSWKTWWRCSIFLIQLPEPTLMS